MSRQIATLAEICLSMGEHCLSRSVFGWVTLVKQLLPRFFDGKVSKVGVIVEVQVEVKVKVEFEVKVVVLIKRGICQM